MKFTIQGVKRPNKKTKELIFYLHVTSGLPFFKIVEPWEVFGECTVWHRVDEALWKRCGTRMEYELSSLWAQYFNQEKIKC